MRVDNGTTDPVDFDQTGGGTDPDPEDAYLEHESYKGQLAPAGQPGDSQTFTPVATFPYNVHFNKTGSKNPQADSGPFTDPDSTVTLNADWTVSISK
ncbi:MAG: hypothetical protein AAF481_05925 [Acidobacteriota bacterium]